MQRFIAIIFVLLGCLAAGNRCYGQFNNGFISTAPPGANMESSNNTSDEEEVIMSKKPAFNARRYFKALAHKDSMKVNQMAIGSMILPGTAQIYNEQYWKLPIVYGAIGGCIGGAIATDNKDARGYLIAGAVASYWGSVLDGVISYKSDLKPHPGRAAMLSAVVPGLGQAYNGDYWKIPIFYTGLGICAYALTFNQEQYKRYKNMYIELNEGTYTGNLTADNITWYRDQHRRLRDYSIIATVLVYALNIIDANVFAHFNTFDISDDLTLNVEPALINPVSGSWNSYASNQMPQSFGLQMNIRF
ncbi:MAG: hypothetical protein J6Q34_01545 [Bacteroidales bacterium]|nr:hypothetical protein [Bacteroidales bacterium]